MTKHSPGPWKLSAYSDETMNPEFLVTESNTNDWPIIVAEVNSEENARLIAAAPDLLEALQNMMGAFDTPIQRRRLGRSSIADKAIESAHAAIQKATKDQV